MYITVNNTDYELKAKLGTALKIENKFKMSLNEIFIKSDTADIDELILMIMIAADKVNDIGFKNEILENWDYSELKGAVDELLARLIFTGTEDEIAKKLKNFPATEQVKQLFARILKISPELIGLTSSEQVTE